MEWEKAKSYLLLFFILLNLALGGLLFMESRRYMVTAEREQTIMTILAQNNITMDTELMRNFAPMRTMSVSGFYYNTEDLVRIFFGSAPVQHTTNFRGYVVTRRPAELVISNGFISYNNPRGRGEITELSSYEARELTNAFVRAYWPDFRLDIEYAGDDGILLTYRQTYRGNWIHSNFIEFFVTEDGIVRIEMQFSQVLGWESADQQPIVPPDEALLTFFQRVRLMAQAAPMVITHMDLVYFQEEGGTDPEVGHRAVPFYRVFVYGGGSDPFLINAITNEIIH
ncbi:MAG: hypothetical protein FWC77_05000 [Defluviitaleaceae bacterium]|nr:hypothetical protein [Defluviitaleaceae bacterium]